MLRSGYVERDRLRIAAFVAGVVGLAVALAMNAFRRLTMLASGAVLLLVTLLATNKILVGLVPTVPLCVHSTGLAAVASVVFVGNIDL